jgi:hypothetical protein
MTARFYGLVADDLGLFYKARQPRTRWECVAWLDPEGLHVQRGRRSPVILAWDDERSVPWQSPTHGPAALPTRQGAEVWWVDAPLSSNLIPSIRQGTATVGLGSIRGSNSRWPLSTFMNRRDASVLDALCQYVAMTPAARPGLADAARCTDLIRALAADNLNGPGRSGVRVGPSKIYAYQVTRDIVNTRTRIFRGRPIAHEPLPDRDDVVAAALAALPPNSLDDWKDPNTIGHYVDQLLAAKPWPFDHLLTPTQDIDPQHS